MPSDHESRFLCKNISSSSIFCTFVASGMMNVMRKEKRGDFLFLLICVFVVTLLGEVLW
ncbi:hypothetical protein PORCRE_1352 [Porphyromonas crevioricanis JCM 15906]|uniref:Uncharacterized protein n=1 Tax=Porphyromonas crevioricanis JCM 15906 TaxID=1305617 RepID=T1CP91_9PORP|nr:hypothetical protein PORCRE_1352 [Porphyromonas crevioricanis JCM 15906]GAD06532.1 hypothetical protein PORCAN_128 [Porphyromonas crevioricanis JCM 13913]